MTTTYDYIIWGPSLEGIKRAIELSQVRKHVLLAGKFGFPGGKATEALATLFPADFFQDNGIMELLLEKIEQLKYGVLFRNKQWILMHPEAVKRVCWELLNESKVELLFHVMPLKITQTDHRELQVFGREGKIVITGKQLEDLSDDKFLDNLTVKDKKKTVVINSFFSDPLPHDFPGFQVTKRFETPVGQYISVSLRNVESTEVEKTFNRELDRLSKESWKKFGARIMMIPVYPEIKEE